MLSRSFYTALIVSLLSSSALAQEPLKPRGEANLRYGDERTIAMGEFWIPLQQDNNSVLYSDIRLMGDSSENREGNIGIGYRAITSAPVLGEGVAGVHGWVDRRITERGSIFHQVTLGAEWLGRDFDILANAYLPISDGKLQTIPGTGRANPYLIGTGIFVDTPGKILEEPQHGFDIELGVPMPFFDKITDSTRVYAGGYYFDSKNTDHVAGGRFRFTADVTPDVAVGTRLQYDNIRNSQAFLEATIRFPFGQKSSYRKNGLHARLADSPERDIDIVTGGKVTDSGLAKPVLNATTGQAQQVLHVDNAAAPGGDGSVERPFNTLAAASAASTTGGIIYVNTGNGTSAGQNQGIVLNKQGQQLIGAGTDFIFDGNRFTVNGGGGPQSIVIKPASTAPLITNLNANSDGVTVSADNVMVSGVRVSGATRDGIVVRASGAGTSAQNVQISNVTTTGNRMGIYIHGTNGGAVSAMVQRSVATGNTQHGMAIYDDTNSAFAADLGGGTMGSVGRNVLAGNTLEDLAVDLDGGTLFARNNWWGQATGADTDAPNVGVRPQIYYGAPINDGLVSHWTFDTEWMNGATAYDRSGQNNNGVLQGGLSATNLVAGGKRQAIQMDGVNDYMSTTIQYNDPNQFTIAAGYNTALANGMKIVAFENDQVGTGSINRDRHIWMGTDGLLRFGVYDGNTDEIAAGVTTNNSQDHYAIATVGPGGAMTFYVDGAQIGTNTSTNPQDYAGYWRIGAYSALGWTNGSAGGYFNGRVDDVRVYNRALTPGEIAEIERMSTSSIVDTGSFLTGQP